MRYPDVPRPDAPAPIAVVRDFVNTDDHETGEDQLATPASLVLYLVTEGLLAASARAGARDLELARRLRAALRAALEQNHDQVVEPLPALDRALSELLVRLAWSDGASVLEPAAGGVAGALARVGIAVHDAVSAGSWQRLKICSFDECEWAYFDHSKNQSRQWCEYGCGNRVKTRAYRARLRASDVG